MNLPIIVVNFKAYVESTGMKSIKIAKIAEEVSKETGIEIAVAPSFADVVKVKELVSIPVFAQHADNISPGGHTGSITVENLKDWNIDGVIINHSEKQLKISEIDALIKKISDLGMKSIACTNNVSVTRAVSALSPDFVAIEPPELIGGDISVSMAKPEVIQDSVKVVKMIDKNVTVLCGAGVKNKNDVKRAYELGAMGILVASGVVKAKDVKSALMDLASGFAGD
ncbi:MAG: triose-phosphate isomerase [Thermoplasmata archaeon]